MYVERLQQDVYLQQEHVSTFGGSDKTYECTDCDPKWIYQMYSNFRQHVKGYHGSGFKSLCGIKYKWPKQHRAHQVDCDDCKRIKIERKEKPVNPNHLKDRKTWKP